MGTCSRLFLYAAVLSPFLLAGCLTQNDAESFNPSLGLEWTLREDLEVEGDKPSLYGVVWSGKMFVGVGGDDQGQAIILTSPDGVTWTRRESGSSIWLRGVASSGKDLLAHGYGGLMHSKDGIIWTSHADPISVQAYVWMGTKWYASSGLGYMTSTDGMEWDVHFTSTGKAFRGMAWTGKLLVGVSSAGKVHTSPDGVTWTVRETGTDGNLRAVIWTGKGLVVIGSYVALTSPDGIAWTVTDLPDPGAGLRDLVWTGNRLVAVGFDGRVKTSPDGLVWTAAEEKTSEDLLDVAASKTRVVVVGHDGLLLTSP